MSRKDLYAHLYADYLEFWFYLLSRFLHNSICKNLKCAYLKYISTDGYQTSILTSKYFLVCYFSIKALFPNSSSIHIIFFLKVQNIYHPYPHPLKKCYFPIMDTVVLSAFKQTFKSTFHFPTIEYSHASTVHCNCIGINQTYSTNSVFILSTA